MTGPGGVSDGERRFQLVVEAAPNSMVMIDLGGKIVMVNTQAERTFGYSRAELVGQPVEMLVPERLRGRHPELRKTFFADPRPRPMGAGRELYGIRKDGSELPVEIGLNPIETGEGPMVLSSIVDITARKAAEQALRDSERRYTLLVDGVTDYAIYMLDPHGIITNWNRGAERIKGYRSEEVVGRHFSCFHTEEDRAANVPQHSLEVAARDGRHESQAWRVRKDGSRFLADVVIDALRDDGGRLIGFAKITRDITERVQAARELEEARVRLVESRAEEALRRAQAELAHVNRVTTLGVLAASIAHEVNQPLGAMVTGAASCARCARSKYGGCAVSQRALERIGQDGRRASEVIDRIRTLVKRQPPRRDRVDVNEAILEVVALTRDEVRRHEIALQMPLAQGLPPVQGDRIQLQQVILNLVVNAIEAMGAVASHPRKLTVRSAMDGANAVRVEVRDSGPGVDAARGDDVFEAFYTTKAEGLGMGLSISHSIIEAHGGRLWVEANEPHGAAFLFTLPAGDTAP